jgi:hypothetical protein
LGYFLVQSQSQVKSRTGKSVNYLRLHQIDATRDSFDEVFKLEIDVNHKLQAKICGNTLLVSIVEGDYSAHKHVIYMYTLKEAHYVGFIKLSEIIGLQVFAGRKVCAIDFTINETADQITVVAGSKVFLLNK